MDESDRVATEGHPYNCFTGAVEAVHHQGRGVLSEGIERRPRLRTHPLSRVVLTASKVDLLTFEAKPIFIND